MKSLLRETEEVSAELSTIAAELKHRQIKPAPSPTTTFALVFCVGAVIMLATVFPGAGAGSAANQPSRRSQSLAVTTDPDRASENGYLRAAIERSARPADSHQTSEWERSNERRKLARAIADEADSRQPSRTQRMLDDYERQRNQRRRNNELAEAIADEAESRQPSRVQQLLDRYERDRERRKHNEELAKAIADEAERRRRRSY